MTFQPSSAQTTHLPRRLWSWQSIAVLLLLWGVLQLGGLFTPGLLDDVDSVYIQVAREMLQRHDFITPTVDGIRFFDKPPLMYWLAAASMRVFGFHDWAARLPLALGVFALLLSVYALGIRFFRSVSPAAHPDRAGLYAAVALATSVGPYLYTRFFIPDILIMLWMTLSIHLFLIALEHVEKGRSPLLPSLGFGAILALDVLTKGLIGIVFPVGFVLLYLALTRRLQALLTLKLWATIAALLAVAAPWHILAAIRNPAIAMPAGLGLPAHAGWAWFYLYNEHIARFLGRRIPHDYGQVPIPLFWLLLFVWLIPWAAFLPSAVINAVKQLRHPKDTSLRFDSDAGAGYGSALAIEATDRRREAALTLLLWPGIVLGFFTLSSRQEYYHLPALPALALLAGGLLAAADQRTRESASAALESARESLIKFGFEGAGLQSRRKSEKIERALAPEGLDQTFPSADLESDTIAPESISNRAPRQALRSSLFFLVPLGTLIFTVCGYLAVSAPSPQPGTDLFSVLSSNPDLYILSLGHMFDLTGRAMGFFRGPLIAVALCMLTLGPGSHFLRRRGRTFAANMLVAASMTGVLLAAHEGLARFYPILGSKPLALAIDNAKAPGDLIAIDGELTAGSTLLFYTGQPVLLVNGRVNGTWFGSFWPDAPHIFLNDDALHRLWSGPHRIFLLTYHPAERTTDLSRFSKVQTLAASGGKTVLTNR